VIAVALAGGAGAAARLVVDGFVRGRLGHSLPWGTLLINIVGSAALGWLAASSASAPWFAIAGTGFLGGFTTFSTASFESARLALERRWAASVGYGLGTLALCVGAAALAYALA
jgi:CrcB protein